MYWSDDAEHRDWETLAECMFDVFVRNPISVDRSLPESRFALARYDIDHDNYGNMSWVACRPKGDEPELAFVRFLSRNEPFDTVQGVAVDSKNMMSERRVSLPFSDVHFSLMLRAPGRADRLVERIEADD